MNIRKLIFILAFFISADMLSAKDIVVGNHRFTFITENLVRFEFALDQEFLDDSTLFAVNRTDNDIQVSIEQKGRKYTFKTARMTIVWDNDGLPFGGENLSVTYPLGDSQHTWKLIHKQRKNLKGALMTLDGVNGTAARHEGLLNREGWYLINDSYKDVYKNGNLELRNKNHIQDYYLFVYGNDYKAAMKSLAAISGKVPMPRKYVHGAWYCRWWPYTADDYREIVKGYHEHDFPMDIIVFDMDWHKKDYNEGPGHANTRGWTGYNWNRDLIPDPEGLIREFNEKGNTPATAFRSSMPATNII